MSLETLTQSSPDPASTQQSHRSFTWLLPVGLLVGFLAILAALFGPRIMPATTVNSAPVVTVRLGQSEADDTAAPDDQPANQSKRLLFQASGWVEPDPFVTYVPTLVDGVVDEVKVIDGQHVKQGELLATLIDDDAILDLEQTEQKVASQKARINAHCVGLDIVDAELNAAGKKKEAHETHLAEASDNLVRLQGVRAGVVSDQSIIRAQLVKKRQAALLAEVSAEIPRLQANRIQIEAERTMMTSSLAELITERDRAKLALDRTRITSPIDGIVLRRHVAPGKKRMLAADDPNSAVIVELYDPNHLQARIDVPLTEAAGLQTGQAVELTSDLLADAVFTGHVTSISGEADLQRNTLQAKVTIDSPDPKLRPETLVRGKFFAAATSGGQTGTTSTNRLALYVPNEALVDSSSVWVVSSSMTAELRQLTLGNETRDGHRRVLDGIRSGEQVILPPHDDLEPGKRIRTESR